MYLYRCQYYRFGRDTACFHGLAPPLFGRNASLFFKYIYLLHTRPPCAHFMFVYLVISYFLARAFTANENSTSRWRHVKHDVKIRRKNAKKLKLGGGGLLPLFHEHFPAFL